MVVRVPSLSLVSALRTTSGVYRRGTATAKFTGDFPGTVLREGADECTLRAHEEGAVRTVIDTTNVEGHRRRLPLVDADWHAFCLATYQGIEGQERKAMYYNSQGLAPGCAEQKKPGEIERPKCCGL